jgi:hypothetical protein
MADLRDALHKRLKRSIDQPHHQHPCVLKQEGEIAARRPRDLMPPRSITMPHISVQCRTENQLLETSIALSTSRRAFEIVLEKAREAGWSDEQITRVTGLSRHQLAAVRAVHLRAA